ncbi:MAG: chalcone isomerase family protein [Burkholderiaceae bacterium]|nr:chalcone isomerase family protein [Burkholderiaceae bacterium]
MSSSTRSKRPEVRASTLVATLITFAAISAEPVAAQAPRATPMTGIAMTQAPHIARYVSDGRLAGEGKLTWLGFHVYDARLYAAPRFDVAAPFGQPFVLELTYARKLEGKAIAEASRDEIQRLGLGDEAQQRRWLAQMEKIFPDVDKGRRIAGVFQPGVGARFYVDGVFAGSVDEPDFGRAFFSIWLDPRTRAPRLRESLLKPAGPTAGLTP